MNEITITTYDKSPKNKNKQRKQKIDIDIDINNILALTTARGDNSKWPKIYVLDYNEPLELPEQSFNDIKNRLLKATKNDSNSENLIFIPVGPKVLVNYHRVFQIKKLTREIVFDNDTVLDDFDEQSLTEFESQVEIIKQRKKATKMIQSKKKGIWCQATSRRCVDRVSDGLCYPISCRNGPRCRPFRQTY